MTHHGRAGGQQGLQPQNTKEPRRCQSPSQTPQIQPQLKAMQRLPSSWGPPVDNAMVSLPFHSLLLTGLARAGREEFTLLLSPLVPTGPGGTPRTQPPVPPQSSQAWALVMVTGDQPLPSLKPVVVQVRCHHSDLAKVQGARGYVAM